MVVVGGGPAGAVTAQQLATRGMQVVVVEAAARPRWKPGEVLAPNCVFALRALGLLDALSNREMASPCLGVRRTWVTPTPRLHDYLVERGGLGFVVDRAAFESHLVERASVAGAKWMWNTRFTAVNREIGKWRLSLRHTVSGAASTQLARFMIDATGRSASVARALGGRRIRGSRRVAVCRVRRERDALAPGWVDVKAHPNGWTYTALGPRVRSDVLVTNRQAIDVERLRGATLCDASYARIDCCAGPGWLAVGDAAASFDPIASQGLPHALSSGMAAAWATLDWMARPKAGTLDHYAAATARTWQSSLRGSLAVYRGQPRWGGTPFWAAAREAR